jgi:preprotein translocase subunit YajC
MDFVSILAQEDSGGSPIVSLGILLLIPAAMYFLMIRPQRRRMKEQQNLQRSIEVGDEVITTSGVYGFITGEDGDKFWLEIDDDVQIRIARAAVQARVSPSASEAGASIDDVRDDAAKSDGQ